MKGWTHESRAGIESVQPSGEVGRMVGYGKPAPVLAVSNVSNLGAVFRCTPYARVRVRVWGVCFIAYRLDGWTPSMFMRVSRSQPPKTGWTRLDTMKNKPMRELMPTIAAFVDAFRDAGLTDNTAIANGLRDGTCWFREGEHFVGLPGADEAAKRVRGITLDQVELGKKKGAA